ncbi:hypothetical protein LCGC14_2086820 [marine sediment metagenome]|uniref:Uncharacterized protein n=1 Tax=marine sediment metagenome TaxID=412755 RepID=A0A0F9EE75_9ZZZZ
MSLLEFKVNDYITLKIENNSEIIIYILENKFRQCKHLFFINPLENRKQEEISSIDEAKGILNNSFEENIDPRTLGISPEEEFWGHCSNLQVWAEHNYDTRILHSELAFPLLRELASVEDPIAKRVFKEEIAKRFEECYLPTVLYLLIENFPKRFLNKDERSNLLLGINSTLKKKIEMELENDIRERKKVSDAMLVLDALIRHYNDVVAKKILKNKIFEILKAEKKDDFDYLYGVEGLDTYLFEEKELKAFLYSSLIFKKIIKNDLHIQKLLKTVLKKMDKLYKRKELFESLILMVNYPEEHKVIAEYMYEELLNTYEN